MESNQRGFRDMPMLIEITRSGKFRALRMQDNSHKCGAMRSKAYEYAVKIEALDVHLTPEGFLINNENIHLYFQVNFGELTTRNWDAMSCENMARKAAKDLRDMLLNESIAVICVSVSIKGSNGAWLTAKAKPEDGTPLAFKGTEAYYD